MGDGPGIDSSHGTSGLVSVCISTVRPHTLSFAVAAVLAQSYSPFELLVVGQGDDPELRAVGDRLATSNPRVRYIHLDELGLSRARNAAVAHARGEIIVFTDDDCEPAQDWLAVIVEAFDAAPDVGAVGGSVLAPAHLGPRCMCPNVEPTEVIYDPARTPWHPPEGWGWIGANFAVRRAVMAEVGRFDEYLGAGTMFATAEDADYRLRLEAHLVRMLSTPRAVVHHTYGARCGLRTRIRQSRNYQRGMGAYAAKLDMAGDRRGREWYDVSRTEWRGLMLRARLDKAALSLYRKRHFGWGFRACKRLMTIDAQTGLLTPR